MRGRHRHRRAARALPSASRSSKPGAAHRHWLASLTERIVTPKGPALREYAFHATKGYRAIRA